PVAQLEATKRPRSRGRRAEMLVAPRLQLLVGVGHELGLGPPEHHLEVGGLEADVLEAVDHVRRTRHAVPWAEDGVRPLARRVLEEHAHLALQDEEDLLDLVRVRRVALAPGTNMTLSVKCSAGIAAASALPDAPE